MYILHNNESLKYFHIILLKLMYPTLGLGDFLSALNLKSKKNIAHAAIHFHPFFILLGADPDK